MAKFIKNAYKGFMSLTMRDALKYLHYAWAVFMTIVAISTWIDTGNIELSVEYGYELVLVYFWFTGVARILRQLKSYVAAKINKSIERKTNRKLARA